MPMDRKLYPDDWDAIALNVKEKAGWKCQECSRECRKTGESLVDFVNRQVGRNWLDNTEMCAEMLEHPQKWTLTVAHLNHQPEDCRPENLKALCAPCHCRYDLKAMATKRRLKAERLGQLTLFTDAKK